jgi:hypothetical protein
VSGLHGAEIPPCSPLLKFTKTTPLPAPAPLNSVTIPCFVTCCSRSRYSGDWPRKKKHRRNQGRPKQLTALVEMAAKHRKLRGGDITSHHAGVTWACVNRQNLRPTRHLDAPPPRSARSVPRHRFEHIANPGSGGGSVMHEAVLNKLERRLGRLHARLRLGIEMDHEAARALVSRLAHSRYFHATSPRSIPAE